MSDTKGASDGQPESKRTTADRRHPDRAESAVGDKRRWSARLRPFGAWSAGIVGTVAATVVTAWLVTWGLLPEDQPPRPSSSQASAAQPPRHEQSASAAPANLPFTVALGAEFTNGAQPVWISGLPPSKVPPRPTGDASYDAWATWAKRAKAVLTSRRPVYFTVQGASAAQVTLLDLKVEVVRRQPPLRGTAYGLVGGDPGYFRSVVADLDKQPPAMSDHYDEEFFTNDFPKRHERRPIRFPYKVSLSDAETFLVDAFTERCDCEFVIKLSWTSQGRTGTHVINDHGSPFRITGNRNARQLCAVNFSEPERCAPWP
jgi:hypothetical protein